MTEGVDCWQSVFLSMRRDVLAKGEWDETWARHAREEKQTAVPSHVFEDIQTCQKLIKLTSKPIKIN